MAVEFKKIAFEDDVITKSLLTAKGDIVYASAAGTPAVLAIGSDDQILKVATDVPTWEDEAAGGGVTIYWQITSAESVSVAARTQYPVFHILDNQGSITLAAGAELVVYS